MEMEELADRKPRLTAEAASALAREVWGVDAAAEPLPGERDLNLRMTAGDGARYVLKVSRAGEDRALLEAQTEAVARLAAAGLPFELPRPVPTRAGEVVAEIRVGETRHLARLVHWVEGVPLAELDSRPASLLRSVGGMLGMVDRTLGGIRHPALEWSLYWDLRTGLDLVDRKAGALPDSERALVEQRATLARAVLTEVEPALRLGPIHGDGNDWNVLVRPGDGAPRVAGLLDFGDMVHTWIVAEPAIAAAYAAMGVDDPVAAVAAVAAGYHAEHPLTGPEIEALWALVGLRLAMSMTIAASQRTQRPDDPYLEVSQPGARDLLRRMADIDPARATAAVRAACRGAETGDMSADRIRAVRADRVGPSLSLSYSSPLHIVRGHMQYLYDADGAEYLDCVNNVAHVGHCHPRVVGALARQAAMLNTNTRYLHPAIARLAERITALMPDGLDVCFFVCSGSEANELALRLARTRTGRRDVVVLDGAYHGNTSALVDMSPYKFDGPGGAGRPDWVHVAPLPDTYRGVHRDPGDDHARRYAEDVGAALDAAAGRGGAAAFFAESLASCGGQVPYPDGFLARAFEKARAAGAVCVADEVQVGFGRVGSHFWGFETQSDAIPDIVTLGKPMGNGHPVAGVVTTREIADAFANGMEYFNTFGGNPVSCEVSLAVLDVIEEEGLQARALDVGAHLRAGLEGLAGRHEAVGDVRGRGMFLGVELVTDRNMRTPATALAASVVEALRRRRVLLSTDGPAENVLKIKPPLQFGREDADRLVMELDEVLR